MKNRANSKIGFSSSYYESLMELKRKLAAQNAFKLVHNSEKDTYQMPYLYQGYKNELNPIAIAN